ncbi:MAG: rhomboid family intramembrane serine protease [Candidatus Sericytochromatia bacterium]|nr:rhomboid family intramembrane serine protease [Candidatus Sericytochromatia bacterium]
MLPLHDENEHTRTPWLTWCLIAANALVFAYQLALPEKAWDGFLQTFALTPAALTADVAAVQSGHYPGLGSFLSLFSCMFLHGGWMHFGGNMLFLYIFGDNIEDQMRPLRFLGFYLLAGLAGSLAHVWSAPHSPLPLLGASGAISGILGAYLVLHPGARIKTLILLFPFIRTVRIPAFIFLGIWFLTQSWQGMASSANEHAATSGGVAWFAHLGGFGVGVLAGLGLRLQRWVLLARRPLSRGYSNRR